MWYLMQYLTTVDVSQTHGQTPRLCSLSHGCIGVIFFTASLKRCACLPWSTERVRIHTVHCPLTRSATTVLITDWHLYIYTIRRSFLPQDLLIFLLLLIVLLSLSQNYNYPSHLSYCKPYKMSIVLSPYWSPDEGIQKLKMEARGAFSLPHWYTYLILIFTAFS